VVFKSRIFPAGMTEENSDEERKIQRRTNHGDPAPGKTRVGGYQLFEPVSLARQHAIQLASLDNFDHHAKIAPEC
jgi:hypothetical protein